jgi:hypothetical protein
MWWTKWHWDTVFFPRVVWFSPASSIPAVLHYTEKFKKINHIYHRVAQKPSMLWCVSSICCGALHHKKKTYKCSLLSRSLQVYRFRLTFFVTNFLLNSTGVYYFMIYYFKPVLLLLSEIPNVTGGSTADYQKHCDIIWEKNEQWRHATTWTTLYSYLLS